MKWAGEPERCAATVHQRDEYRYSGHGPTGFSMHYRQARCTRPALPGTTACWQHDPAQAAVRLAQAAERRAKWRRERETRAEREARWADLKVSPSDS